MTNILGIDAGGTSVRAVALDHTGQALATARGGRANPVSSSRNEAFGQIAQATLAATAQAGLEPKDFNVITIGAAGRQHWRIDDFLEKEFQNIGFRAPDLVSDVLAAFFTGTHERDGYAVVCGTGSVAVRVTGATVTAVADGMGWLLGDAGSGFWIGQQVARAVCAELDERGPATALTPALLDQIRVPVNSARGHEGRTETMLAFSRELLAWSPIELARLAPLAFAVGEDPIATGIQAEAARALANTLSSVYDPDSPGPIVTGGSVINRQPVLADALRQVPRSHRQDPVVIPAADGLVGAGVLGLLAAGVEVTAAVHARLTQSLTGLQAD